MISSPPNFLGLSMRLAASETARAAILPVPYERTVSYGKGTARGPAAIIAASQQVELYDEELGRDPSEIGVATLKALPVEGLSAREMAATVQAGVAGIVAEGKLPIVLGGEHSITPPAVKAMSAAHGDLTVVQLDAHADLRQEYEGDPMSHACAMARVREVCPAVQIGIRNISREEAEWVRREKLPVFFAHAMHDDDRWMAEAIAAIGTEKVYVTIDLDAFDSSIMPATGTPEPGGMTWFQVSRFIRTLTEKKRVVGFDLVELAPIEGLHACDFLAAKLAYKCIGYWTRGGLTAASPRISS